MPKCAICRRWPRHPPCRVNQVGGSARVALSRAGTLEFAYEVLCSINRFLKSVKLEPKAKDKASDHGSGTFREVTCAQDPLSVTRTRKNPACLKVSGTYPP
eukprot:Plantae.Rhodophyta-Rhodochaete_pulchella.ctg41139.p4 GENE.Plantae.Rhodophyta-Rhodochaete_pulchella.ctg41139~~Plantae.Rhodophyta-Rhodochaete_pulchella.ctg41139.p4  ORF type:complete len:101 (+),score=4.48 Plantae.Rhodophyta-Rhodochaete_pulchella.ctg41139:1592-1894(+)